MDTTATTGAQARDAVLVGVVSNAVIIAFRGTLPLDTVGVSNDVVVADWLNDANAGLVTTQTGSIHAGFYSSLNQVWSPLLAKLEAMRQSGAINDTTPIYVTGHSKGGALATIAAARLQENGFKVAAVYTFAAARPGGDDFAAAYEAMKIPTWRYENENDIVPHLPPDADELDALHATGDVLLATLIQSHDHYASVGPLRYITTNLAIIEVAETNPAMERLRRSQFVHVAEGNITHHSLMQLLVNAHAVGAPAPLDVPDGHRYYRATCGEG